MGRRDNNKPQEQKQQLSQLDKTFFELTITDLNNKLSHLRTHNAKLEERNEELEAQMAQLEEDRADVTAYLDRSLHTKVSNIKDLEEKLSELAKVRAEETKDFLRQIKDWEIKFKTMEDELTSEIKLLNGKLNSLEEFRIQKDDLMAKFDQQDSALKEQTKRHKDILYEMERKQVIDKDRLKKDVENKLLQLSNEFAKSNEIRISAHVQRLVRENIALNNELDRMMFSQRRLQNENKDMLEENAEKRGINAAILDENKKLIRSCDTQVEIIKKLTVKCEEIKEKNSKLTESDRAFKMSVNREELYAEELTGFQQKIIQLEQHIQHIEAECKSHKIIVDEYQQESERLSNILTKLKDTIKESAKRDESQKHKSSIHDSDREHLIAELLGVLLKVEDGPALSRPFDSITTINELYNKGDAGVTPRNKVSNLLKFTRPLGQFTRSISPSPTPTDDLQVTYQPKPYDSHPIYDLDSGSVFFMSESSKGEELQQTERHDDDDDFDQSSDDEDKAAVAAPKSPTDSKDKSLEKPKSMSLEKSKSKSKSEDSI